jgi:hypothetical protein
MSCMLRCVGRMAFDYVPFKNRLSLGESDCLIKKSKETNSESFFLFVISAQCLECQSEEIRVSTG